MAATRVGAPRTNIVSTAGTPYLLKKPRSRATQRGATRAFIAAWAMTTGRPADAASEDSNAAKPFRTTVTATSNHRIISPFVSAESRPDRYGIIPNASEESFFVSRSPIACAPRNDIRRGWTHVRVRV